MKLKKELEEKIKAECIKLLEKGKPNWDVPHTLNAVKWAKKIIKREGGNEKILVTAMYFHDTGYPVIKEGWGFEEAMKSKKNHAKRGANNVRRVLKKIKEFNKREISEIAYLVANHNKHDNVVEYNRKVIMDSDGLSMIDIKAVNPTWGKKEYRKFLKKYFLKERPSERWHTKTGKKYLAKFFKEACEYCGLKVKL